MDDCIIISDDEDAVRGPPPIIDLTESPSQKRSITLSDSDSDIQPANQPSPINNRQPSVVVIQVRKRLRRQSQRHQHSNTSSVPKSTPNHLAQVTPQPPPPPPAEPPAVTLKCPICIETYVDIKQRGLKVVITRCGHLFCDFCLKKALTENGRHCPKCRKAVPRGPTGTIQVYDI